MIEKVQLEGCQQMLLLRELSPGQQQQQQQPYTIKSLRNHLHFSTAQACFWTRIAALQICPILKSC